MTTEAAFLQAILDQPAADDTWLVLADWLEERGHDLRAELVRLQVLLRREPRWRTRSRMEKRAQELLAAGVQPLVAGFTNSLGMAFALVPPGHFWMGSSRLHPWADIDENPRHGVTLTRPFFLGIHQVTQDQYQQVMQTNPSYFGPSGPGGSLVQHLDRGKLPVEMVSFTDALTFCARLSEHDEEARAGRVYRLPTEAEWEYACRAGICHSAYHFGGSLTAEHARFGGECGGHPLPVGSCRPNLFGLCDMHGNLWEWCNDWYDDQHYRKTHQTDPTGPLRGHRRVLRGGGWSTPGELCRSAVRGHNNVEARHNYNGFRLALSVNLA